MSEEITNHTCPFCKEEIKPDAIKCKHCGSALEAEKPAHEGICPYCKEEIHSDAIKCKHCKSNLDSKKEASSGCGCEHNSPMSSPAQILPQMPDTDFSSDYPPYEDENIDFSASRFGGIGIPDSPIFGGGTLGAWGCFPSTCGCLRTGLCPSPTTGRPVRCCLIRKKCTRCIWPW